MAQTYEERIAKMKECNKRLHDERIKWGLCFRCGKPLTEETTLQCKDCLAKAAEWRELHREEDRERQRRRMADHRAKGLCLYCNAPATAGTQCEYHRNYYLLKNRESQRRRYQKKKAEAQND